MRKYAGGLGLGSVDEKLTEKFLYYIERDMMGFGPLNVIMDDYRVEDISCDGVGIPIYVWHRDYESLPTNIIFTDREALDNFIIHLAHKAGKHVSSAFPIVDAMIYGKHRLAATFREEISPRDVPNHPSAKPQIKNPKATVSDARIITPILVSARFNLLLAHLETFLGVAEAS